MSLRIVSAQQRLQRQADDYKSEQDGYHHSRQVLEGSRAQEPQARLGVDPLWPHHHGGHQDDESSQTAGRPRLGIRQEKGPQQEGKLAQELQCTVSRMRIAQGSGRFPQEPPAGRGLGPLLPKHTRSYHGNESGQAMGGPWLKAHQEKASQQEDKLAQESQHTGPQVSLAGHGGFSQEPCARWSLCPLWPHHNGGH
ncbi:MAG: hypothetical protein JSV31_06300 [Desulfobacterales bacterium]|nr:MAG: hypothetical protein JSV31_06300 [Desulfobacterales bacterium]